MLLPGGFLAFVEVKRPSGGVVSASQQFYTGLIAELGQRHYIIHTKQGVDKLLADWRTSHE